MRRAATSYCILLRDEIGRVDLDARGEPQFVVRRKRVVGSETREAFQALISAAPLANAVVWVDESIWTQTIVLPRAQVADIDSAALKDALGFEVEPLMGLASDRSEIAFLRAESTAEDPSQAVFWVAAVAKGELDSIERSCSDHAARLVAWLHPAGSSEDSDRVEVFDLATLIRENGAFPTLVAARPGQGSWRAWLGEFVARVRSNPREIEVLDPLGSTADVFAELATRKVGSPLADDAAARAFTQQVHSALRCRAVPVGRRERPRRVVFTPMRVALSALLLIVGWIAYDIAALDREALAIESEAAAAEKVRADADRLRKSKQEAERTVERLRAEVEHSRRVLESIDRALTPQRTRISKLLGLLAAECPTGVMLESIASDDDGDLEIHGIAMTRALVDRLAVALQEPLAPLEMSVEPPETESSALSNGRSITRFRVRIGLLPTISGGLDGGAEPSRAGKQSGSARSTPRGRG